jgi:hypothetical protein
LRSTRFEAGMSEQNSLNSSLKQTDGPERGRPCFF